MLDIVGLLIKKGMGNDVSRKKSKETRYPLSLYWVYFGVLLLMSGLHTGLIVLMDTYHWHKIIQSCVPLIYWALVALGLTFYTRRKIKLTYDKPLVEFADATKKVAGGDFSVFMPTVHTADKQDYLDLMIIDFNKMVEELGSIETLKTDFFSNVSHEIKTPLAIIQNYAELLQNDNLSDEQKQEYAGSILQATKRLSSLITNMLKLNKLEKQAIHPQAERYDLCRQLTDCILQFEDVWEKKNIEIIPEIEDEAFINADIGLMDIVWNNLFSNAIKFTDNDGTISILQTSDANEITVTITDSGCGMSEETASHVFDKFYQGDTSHSTEGNGLGLALVQRIIDISGCTISVKSEINKGTEFTVKIPVSSNNEVNI